jgi:hypothetical protein
MVMIGPAIVLAALVAAQGTPFASEFSAPAMSQPTEDARPMTLTLPHALQKGETAWLLVKVGDIDHSQIQLTTQDGRPVGTISPFALRSGQAAGTYTVPVPPEAFDDRRLALRLSVLQTGRAQRAPTTDEVISLRLVVRRFKGSS